MGLILIIVALLILVITAFAVGEKRHASVAIEAAQTFGCVLLIIALIVVSVLIPSIRTEISSEQAFQDYGASTYRATIEQEKALLSEYNNNNNMIDGSIERRGQTDNISSLIQEYNKAVLYHNRKVITMGHWSNSFLIGLFYPKELDNLSIVRIEY